MTRCSTIAARWMSAATMLAAVSTTIFSTAAFAQSGAPQRIPPISAKAVPGVLRVTTPPDVILDSKPDRLAPGARIRNRNNLLVVSGALIGQDLPVRYTRDMLGLVHEVWVLTPAELAGSTQPAPASSSH